jgi:predicted DCC family thiol-disulfide oxidoreductase YuxK
MRLSETDLIIMQAVVSASAEDDQKDGPTIYFDGSCSLCSVEINHYASRDGGDRLEFVDVSAEDAELGTGLLSGDARRRFHVRLVDGTLLSGAHAFVAVWDSLPGWKWAARLASIPGAMLALEAAYRAFLPIRPFLSMLARRLGARAANPRSSQQ